MLYIKLILKDPILEPQKPQILIRDLSNIKILYYVAEELVMVNKIYVLIVL